MQALPQLLSQRSEVIDFDGESSLLYRFVQNTRSLGKDVISLKFKTLQSDGILFHRDGRNGNCITLELVKGKLVLFTNSGNTTQPSPRGQGGLALGSLLDDGHWHTVWLERSGQGLNLTVDRRSQSFWAPADLRHVDLDPEISFGGIFAPGKPIVFPRKNFHGCLENINFNGEDVIGLAKQQRPQVLVTGTVAFACAHPQTVPATFPSARSYLALPGSPGADGASVSFQFRTWNRAGLLLSWGPRPGSGDFFLALQDGNLHVGPRASPGQAQSGGRTGNSGPGPSWARSADFRDSWEPHFPRTQAPAVYTTGSTRVPEKGCPPLGSGILEPPSTPPHAASPHPRAPYWILAAPPPLRAVLLLLLHTLKMCGGSHRGLDQEVGVGWGSHSWGGSVAPSVAPSAAPCPPRAQLLTAA
ncbi:contactin-associated protein-like 3 [Pongo abelii]|uniref:contactin-associated protein-like 3 n=1 Tax=Pongo abelii TaxID=9601 RepID=UPI0023E7A4EF|nr:contactin-associated protein-like 3 [Pongo abelii]